MRARLPVFLLALTACKPDRPAPDVRGAGAPVARLDTEQRATIYDRAVRQAFDITPDLVLLLDPAKLPRAGGTGRDDLIPSPVLRALESRGSLRGRCEPSAGDTSRAPACAESRPGYLVRFSDIFDRPGDTLRVFVAFERYQPAGAASMSGRYGYEDGYDLVPDAASWRVVQRARRRTS